MEQTLKDAIDCPVRRSIYRLIGATTESKKGRIFMEAGKQCLVQYLSNRDRHVFETYFRRAYADLEFPYEWSFETSVSEDAFKWERLISHIFDRPNGTEQGKQPVYEPDPAITLQDSYRKVKTVLGWTEIPIITKIGEGKTASYHAYYLRNRKNTGYISNSARKPENRPENNVVLASIKLALEHDYPGVIVHCIGITSNNDSTATMAPRLGNPDDAFHSFDEWFSSGKAGAGLEGFIREQLARLLGSMNCADCKFENVYCHAAKYIPETEKKKESKGNLLTDNQMRAVHTVEGPVLVSACPGSGKTTAMVERMRYMVEVCKIPPERILMVTFSRSAAENLLARVPVAGNGATPYIATIHSLCLDIMRRVDSTINIEETNVRYSILNTLIRQTKIQGATSSGLYTPQSGFIVRLDKVIQDIREGKNPKFGSFSEEEIRALYERYEAIRKQKNCVSYDELLVMTLEKLKELPSLGRLLRTQYRYIMVDEYQDVDSVQDEILRLIAGENGNLFVVGDSDQSIYGFRGGSNRYMLDFTKHYPKAEIVYLNDNFRSTEEVVNYADGLIRHNKDRIVMDFHAHKHGKPVENYNGIIWEPDLDCILQEFHREGYSDGDIAIITRNNAELKKINQILGRDRSRLNRALLYRDPIFGTILSVLRLWRNPEESEAFLRLVAIHTDINLAEVSGHGFYAFLDPDGAYYGTFRELLSRVHTLVDGVTPESRPEDVFRQILQTFFGIQKHSVVSTLEDYMLQANTFTVQGALQIASGLFEIQTDTRVINPPDNRITLLTAHDSKGLEFPCVIVCGLEDFDYGDEETRRLLYVAMTRAEDRLAVCQTAGTTLSPYWRELQKD